MDIFTALMQVFFGLISIGSIIGAISLSAACIVYGIEYEWPIIKIIKYTLLCIVACIVLCFVSGNMSQFFGDRVPEKIEQTTKCECVNE